MGARSRRRRLSGCGAVVPHLTWESRGSGEVPRTGETAQRSGTYVDEHGHTVTVREGATMPACPDGDTMWWHEDLPVAKHMVWEAQRRQEKIRRWAHKRAR